MWAMTSTDRLELERYRATGLTPDEITALRDGPLPDDDGRAPLPLSEVDDA